MASGYDKTPPPEGRYEPDFGWVGRLFVVVLVMLVAVLGFGHLFI